MEIKLLIYALNSSFRHNPEGYRFCLILTFLVILTLDLRKCRMELNVNGDGIRS